MDLLSHLFVSLTGGGITARVIVDKYKTPCLVEDHVVKHISWMAEGFIDGAVGELDGAHVL